MFAICYTRPGTTLTFWLNRFSWGGYIWSLVRSTEQDHSDQRWNQPPLRFSERVEAEQFIQSELAGNPEARVVMVED
ncbi:MAG: hypothetical protein ACHQX3_01025 [Nitrospirales bacterium]